MGNLFFFQKNALGSESVNILIVVEKCIAHELIINNMGLETRLSGKSIFAATFPSKNSLSSWK